MKYLLIVSTMVCNLANAESTFQIHKPLPYGKIKTVLEMYIPKGSYTRNELTICHTAETAKNLERKYDTKNCKTKIIKDTINLAIAEVACTIEGNIVNSRFESKTISPHEKVVKTFDGLSNLEIVATQIWVGDCK